jgi:LysM repeat protein
VRLPDGWWSESFEFDQGVVTATLVKRCSESMSVCIRADGTMVHRVQVGDTLSGIADAYGVTQAALLVANPQITDPSLIHPGDLLTIPGGGSTP